MPRPVGVVVRSLIVMVAALTVVSHLGRLWWPFDLVANFRPQLILVAAVAVVGAVAGRRRPWIVAAAVVLVLDVAAVAPYLVGTARGVAEGADTIEVVAFNVGISNPERAAAVAYLEAEDPDIVFLFESSFEWEDQIRRSDLELSFVVEVPEDRLAGVTVLARPDIEPLPLPNPVTGEAAALSIVLGTERVVVLGLHPPSPTTSDRAAARDRMLDTAAEWAATRRGEIIVVGDLNASPWSHAFRNLRIEGRLVDSLRGRGLQPTWPAGWGPLMITIDHALHSEGLAVADRRTGPSLGSTHRPLIVRMGPAG